MTTTPPLDPAAWRKASASAGQNGCIEINTSTPGTVAIRDSKLGPDSPILCFSPHEFDCFTDGVHRGEFS